LVMVGAGIDGVWLCGSVSLWGGLDSRECFGGPWICLVVPGVFGVLVSVAVSQSSCLI